MIVPAFNAETFIEQTLRSVLQQTRAPDEIVVVDDGSTDGTREVARSIDRRIVVIEQANAGVCAARNLGAASTSGELLAFLDADDVWAPSKLEAQVDAFQRFPSAALVATGFDEIDADGLPMTRPTKQPLHVYGKLMNMHRELLHQGNVLAMSSTMVRRAAFDSVGGFYVERRILSADYDMWIRLSEAHDFYVVPEPLLHYRVLNSSLLHGSLSKEYGAQLGILDKHRHRFTEAQYRARLAKWKADWADSALFEDDPDAWRVWREALSRDFIDPQIWLIGLRAVVRRVSKVLRTPSG